MKALLSVLLSFSLGTQAFGYSDSEAIQRLGRHLNTLEEKAHKQRMIGGATMLAFGTAGAIGFFAARNSSNPDTRDTIAPIVGIAGGLFLIMGTFALLVPGNDETLPQEYKTIPDANPRAKITAGEDMLRLLSKEAKRERLISAWSGAAIGAAQIIWYAADSGSSTSNRSYLLYNGALFAGLAAVGFFIKRPAEEEWEAYREWKGEANVSASLGIVPTLGIPTPALVLNF